MKRLFKDKEKGSTLLTSLAAVAICGTIFAISSQKVNKEERSQKLMISRIAHADLQKKLNTICSNIFVVRNSHPFNSGNARSRLRSCVEKSTTGSCRTSTFQASLFNNNGSIRYTGPESCGALYSYYGAALSTNNNKGKCVDLRDYKKIVLPNNEFYKEAYFGVTSSVKPHCPNGAGSCDTPDYINVSCSAVSLKGPSKGLPLDSNFRITGFNCPPGLAVRAITSTGRLSCERPRRLTGLTGNRGPRGPKGANGSNGTDGVSYSYRRNGNHGCFAQGTMIKTIQGEMSVEDIGPNDLVWNPIKKTYQRVRKMVIGPEYRPLISIKIGSKTLDVTDSHPMHTIDGTIPAKDLQVGDQLITYQGVQSITQVSSKFSVDAPNVYNIHLEGTNDFSDHYVVANSMVTGDLYIQLELNKSNEEIFTVENVKIFQGEGK